MDVTRMPDRSSALLVWLLLAPLALLSHSAVSTGPAVEPPPLEIDVPGQPDQPTLDPALDPAQPIEPAASIDVQRGLAGQLIRSGSELLRAETLTVQGMEAALLLAQEAVDVAPDDPEAWYYLLSIATLTERDDVVDRAVSRLVELDPANDHVLLRKLRREIEAKQIAAERAERYEREIDRNDLPDTIRSRLAFDLAILERRRGRTDAFAEWLAESVALDRSHTAAAALAAGYFRLHVNDAVGAGELLLTQFLANPTDISAQMLTANHMLDHGAYDAAERLYTLATQCYESIALVSVPGELIADLAIARWGAGRPTAALRQIEDYQHELDRQYRERLLHEDQDLSPQDRAKRHAPMPLTVAVTAAAIRVRQDQDQGRAMIQGVVDMYQQRIEAAIDEARQEAQSLDPRIEEEIAKFWLEAAWLAVWLSPRPERAGEFVARATDLIELSERAEARIEGWTALRTGDIEQAIEKLQPHASRDPAAGLGYATALLARGERRNAARQFLQVVRMQPGSLIGVWAGDQLAELLGRRAPISDEASQLNQLMRDVPRYIDHFPKRPSTMLSLRIRPTKDRFDPYEPIRVDLEITNRSARPLAIDPDGPILPEIALLFDVRFSGRLDQPTVEPVIVNIHRRLRLESNERLTIPLDLRRTPLGAVIDQQPVNGAIVTLRAVSNFYITPRGSLLPNLLGSEHLAPPIRIDGRRIVDGGVERMHRAVTEASGPPPEVDMAMLLYLYVTNSFRDLSQAEMQWLSRQILAVTETYNNLEPIEQAWMLSVVPIRVGVLRPLLNVARQSDHRLVQLCALMYGGASLSDEEMQMYVNHDDPRIRRLARIFTQHPDAADWQQDALGGDEWD